MIVKKSPNDIFVELRETTECLFGIHSKNPIPINLGFLNYHGVCRWKKSSTWYFK
jgi:homoserine kinase type II